MIDLVGDQSGNAALEHRDLRLPVDVLCSTWMTSGLGTMPRTSKKLRHRYQFCERW
jgi:hypothetical protein